MEEKTYKAMIISVGGTPEPIVKSISHYIPEFVSFFASQETCDSIAAIKRGIEDSCGLEIRSERTLVDNADDLRHCFPLAKESVKRVMDKGYNKEDVIVDYTGGTKNMSVALALASVTYGLRYSYVGGTQRTKDGVGIVQDGHETVYDSVNPWDLLAVEDKKKISLLFNQYQFKAAKDLLDALVQKGVEGGFHFKLLASLVDGYYKWDLFKHNQAQDSFTKGKVDLLQEFHDNGIRAFAEATKKNLEIVNVLSEAKGRCSRRVHHVLDMYANALRRFKEGKTDDAVLRLYRLVEMIAQERLLHTYEINTSDVKEKQLPEALREGFVHKYKDRGTIKLPQNASLQLLLELGDELGQVYLLNEDNFRKLQSERNQSYLAHGLNSSQESTYDKLRKFILDLKAFNESDVPVFPRLEFDD
ncbi:TIGR02710 family CRISPR-associated CARF protein [Candidatus Magnetobacterium casense]|uniref:TIGR02710 family CRISPR-associated protein n=1 Tax=Candidatus Magnetobacterium casense TaxID=1455061 RepID=A0ABS6S039_9BACT|nr:TIGR02710 family CRISPR-associated CARF protein [Candidatus Magnetobacterium casensis]MBV6341992.1 TIGR02710 family CRISPR-associated protein [Candidatus Magnetobacterium casensis]